MPPIEQLEEMEIETTEEEIEEVEEHDGEVEEDATDEGQDEPEGEESEPEEDSDSIVVDLDQEEDDDDTPVIRKMRERIKELNKENRDLKKSVEPSGQGEKKLRPKPTLEEFDYDSDEYEKAIDSWYSEKREFDAIEEAKKIEAEEQQIAWSNTLNSYEEKKASLGVKDYEDIEDEVFSTLNEVQKASIIHTADNPALVVYALGRNPEELSKLSGIKDNAKFIREIARLEDKRLTTSRKPATKPEKTVSGTAKPSGSSEATLDRLRKEAAETGDFSKVHAYRQKMRANAK